MSGRMLKSYSENFKLKVIGEIESGKYSTTEAGIVYGIGGSCTVSKWLKKYGKGHLVGKVVRVETADERSRIRDLEGEKNSLEKALSQAFQKIMFLESKLEIAECELGYTIEKKSV